MTSRAWVGAKITPSPACTGPLFSWKLSSNSRPRAGTPAVCTTKAEVTVSVGSPVSVRDGCAESVTGTFVSVKSCCVSVMLTVTDSVGGGSGIVAETDSEALAEAVAVWPWDALAEP